MVTANANPFQRDIAVKGRKYWLSLHLISYIMKKTIIITGGAGYIGSHTLIELLANPNYHIVSVDNYSNSSPDAYKRVRKIAGRDFDIMEFDLCDEQELKKQFSKLSNVVGIIHFAAFKSVPESVANPVLYYHNNIASLNNILRYVQAQRIENFIFSSSCSVYGNAKDLPVTEETPLMKSESPYGHTKQIGEDMIRFFCQANPSVKAVLLRYFNPVGAHISGLIGELPSNKPNNLVPIITQTAVGKNSLLVFGNDYNTRDGSCVRDYIHVSDIAEAHVNALTLLIEGKNHKQVSLFNLGTGRGVTVLEAISSFEKVAERKLEYKVGPRREGDVVAIYANNQLAKSQLNWVPRYDLDDMMLSAWKWQMNLETS
jgi:UDP-glucose 4-epimerase